MESSKRKAFLQRTKRSLRVRSHIHGTGMKPRLCVVKSNKHIHVQLIDDDARGTLASLSTTSKEIRSTEFAKKSKSAAKHIGEVIAERAKKLGITQMIFDRGPFKYHGILKELADAVRAQGIQL